MRFFRDTLARMREEAPHDRFLYTVRISAFEGIPGGFGSVDAASPEPDPDRTELLAFARAAEAAGVHLLNQSSGVPELTPLLVRQTNENPLGFHDHQAHAAALKRAVSVPVVGSGYSYPKAGVNKLPGDEPAEKSLVKLAARALAAGEVDLIGIGRQCLSDPGFARKLLAGEWDEIRWDTSCNQCAVSLRSGIHAGCVTYDRYYKERFREMRKSARRGG
jgi:2,4-dienoyl-CoA reductase-like NADH-dependent reductase (Old Yellow Enzyme family)